MDKRNFSESLSDAILPEWTEGEEYVLSPVEFRGSEHDQHDQEDERLQVLRAQVDLLADEIERKDRKVLEVKESFQVHLQEWERDLRRERLDKQAREKRITELESENLRLREELRDANDKIQALIAAVSQEHSSDLLQDVDDSLAQLELTSRSSIHSPSSRPRSRRTSEQDSESLVHNHSRSILWNSPKHLSAASVVTSLSSPFPPLLDHSKSSQQHNTDIKPRDSYELKEQLAFKPKHNVEIKSSKSALDMLKEIRRQRLSNRPQEQQQSDEGEREEEASWLYDEEQESSSSDEREGGVSCPEEERSPTQTHFEEDLSIDNKAWQFELAAERRFRQRQLRQTAKETVLEQKLLELWDRLNISFQEREKLLEETEQLDPKEKAHRIVSQIDQLRTKRENLKLSGVCAQVKLLEQLYANEQGARKNMELQKRLAKPVQKLAQRIVVIMKERKRTERLVKLAVRNWEKQQRQTFSFRGFPYLELLQLREQQELSRDSDSSVMRFLKHNGKRSKTIKPSHTM